MRNLVPALIAGVLLCVATSTVRADTPDEQLAAASALFDAHKYAEAAQKLDAFLAANPKHEKANTAAFVLGQARSELKDYDKAIPAYEKAIAGKDPAIMPLAELGLGQAAIAAGKFDKADTALEPLTAGGKGGSLEADQRAVAWYWYGQAEFRLKKYDKALEAYDRVTHDYTRSDFVDDAFFGAGLSAFRLSRTDDARGRLRTVVDRFPNSEDRPKALLLLGQIDFTAKRFGDARDDFERVLRDGGKGAGPDLQKSAEDGLIQALLAMKDDSGAASHLEALVGRLPTSDPLHFRSALTLGHCRYRLRQYGQAFAAYQEAAKSPETGVASEGQYWAGNAELQDGHKAEAAGIFSRFVTRFPKSDLAPKAELSAGDALFDAGQRDQAAAAYRDLVERYPQSSEAVDAHKALGELVQAITDPDQLATALKTASPSERVTGMLRLTRLYLAAKRYPDASRSAAEVIRLKPADDTLADADYLAGLAADAQTKSAPAAEALAAAVRLKPSAPWAVDAQGRLAWLYLDLKQPVSAEKAAAAALDLKPAKPAEEQARLAQIQARLDQQKWDLALESCKALQSIGPGPDAMATALFTQAWVLEKQGQTDAALPVWERLANDYPKSSYTDAALLHVGDARLKAKEYDQARDRYAALIAGFPKSPFIAQARFKMASALLYQKQYADAAPLFDQIAGDSASGDYAPESLYLAGVAFEGADRKDEAIRRFSKLVTAYPKHKRVPDARIHLAALKAVSGN